MASTHRLTKLVVDRMRPGDIVRDSEIKGFGARCQHGAPSYFLQKKVHGRLRWFTIGPHGNPWTPETARREAFRILRELAAGTDPGLDRQRERAQPVFHDAHGAFMADHGPKLKPRTRSEYEKVFRNYLLAGFKGRRLKDITKAEVARFHARLADTPAAANFALSVLSRLMRWAEDQGYRAPNSNPCQGVKKYKLVKRQRYLSPNEFARLGRVLDDVAQRGSQNLFAVAAIRLLILTGARHTEILSLQWSFVDVERGFLNLPDSKTGQKAIRLNAAAAHVLAGIPRVGDNPYVIVGKLKGAHLVNLQKIWDDIRIVADLPDVRIHDLRHSFASMAVAHGGSLPMIGKLLGHMDTQTTARYAHLRDDPLRHLNNQVGEAIVAAMQADTQSKGAQ